MLLHSVILPIELKNANTGRTRHFGGSNRERKQYARLLKTLGHRRKPFAVQTDVVVTRILGSNQRLWDASSVLRGNWKELEDALVEAGWWWGDDKQELQLVNFDNSDGFHASGVHVENLCKYWKFCDTKKPVGKEVTQ